VQLEVCARAKAVESIKAIKANRGETCPRFGQHGSIRYDARAYHLMSLDRVSLNSLEGHVVSQPLLGVRRHAMLVGPACDVAPRSSVEIEPDGGTMDMVLSVTDVALR
jgi:hypothetical protein